MVRANYNDIRNGIHQTTEYLELFLRNLLLGESNELHNRSMHISGAFNHFKKADIRMKDIYGDLVDFEDATDQDTDQDDDQVKIDDPNVRKLLDIVGERTLSALEIMEGLGLKHRPTFRKNYLNPALKLGVIERTIPDKPNSRNQKYKAKS